MAQPLTPKQQALLDFITEYQEGHDCTPSIREMCEACNVASTNTIDYHLKALERKGAIRRPGNLARSIEILRPRPRLAPGVVRLPIRGEIAAGLPIIANDDDSDYCDMPLAMAGARDAYVLRVRGESMIDEHICNGDLVVVRPCSTARDGEIVVALLADNGVTLKTFFREKNRIRLQPANATMAPIIIEAGEECAIQGTVMTVIRQVA